MVSARLINARDDLSAAVGVERRLHLVAVVIRVFHTDYRLHPAKAFKELFHLVLLEAKLLGIAEILKLTAPAFFVYRTASVLDVALCL